MVGRTAGAGVASEHRAGYRGEHDLVVTAVELSTGANSATVKGRNDSGSTRTLSARVYCILLA